MNSILGKNTHQHVQRSFGNTITGETRRRARADTRQTSPQIHDDFAVSLLDEWQEGLRDVHGSHNISMQDVGEIVWFGCERCVKHSLLFFNALYKG